MKTTNLAKQEKHAEEAGGADADVDTAEYDTADATADITAVRLVSMLDTHHSIFS